MTFATNIAKASSKRHTFVRIEGTQIIDSGDMNKSADYYYDYVVDRKPTSVSLYDEDIVTTDYTEDTALSVADTWYYTESTNTLYVRTSNATLGSNDKILSDYMLTYTDSQDQPLTIDPVTGGDTYIWEDRLKSIPRVTETIKNATDGVMSVSATSLSLENSDLTLNSLLGLNKTYRGREIKIWMSVDGVFSALFRGEVTTIDVTATTVVFGAVEQSIAFDKPAYIGAKAGAIYGDTGAVVNKHYGRPIPIIIGSSPYKVSSGLITAGTYNYETMDYEGLTTAVCRAPSYNSGSPTTSQNRTWTMCRSLPSDGVNTRSTGTGTVTLDSKGSSGTYNGVNIGTIDITATGGYACREGDVIIATDASYSNAEVGFVVVKLLTSTLYRVAILPIQGGVPGAGSVTARFTMETTTRSHSGILYQGATGNKYIMIEGMDFNLSTSTDASGLTKNNAVFITDFEGTLYKNQGVGMTTLNPYNDEFRFYRHADGVEHATMVEELLEADDYTIDATSITNALADDVSGICVMSIPDTNADEFPTMRTVLSEMVGSTFGYIRLDATGTVFYELFRVPATPTEERDDDQVLSSSVIPRISYYDMASQYVIKNRHLGSDYKERVITDSNLPLTTKSTLAQAVYRSDKVKNFKTVFLTASGDYLTQLDELFAVPRVTYKYAVDAVDLNATVGDTIKLTAGNLLGTVTSVNLLITNIIRSSNQVAITGIELT